MKKDDKSQLLTYLLGFITENKKRKIDQIIKDRTRHVTVVLEDIYQSHNASAALRSAECFGVQDVHIIQKRNKFRAQQGIAMGSSKWLDLVQHKSTESCFEQLKRDGYRIVALTPHERTCTLQELKLDKKLALVFGTEEAGLSAQATALADEFVAIEMYGFTESFNVSVSVSICLNHIMTELHQSFIDWRLSVQEIIDLRLQWSRAIIRGSDALERAFFSKEKR